MSRSRPTRPSLQQAIQDPGFSPSREDLEGLVALLDLPDEKVARDAERALARLGIAAADAAWQRLPSTGPPLRGRLCRVVGRVARQTGDQPLIGALVDLVRDDDPRTRRYAATALGKLASVAAPDEAGLRDAGPRDRPAGNGLSVPGGWTTARIEQALIESWCLDDDVVQRRALAAALGKIGGNCALELLRSARPTDRELKRIAGEAILKIERTLARQSPSRLEPTRSAPAVLEVLFHCRAGLENLLVEELGSALRPRIVGDGLVEGLHRGPMEALYRARTMLRFGFPLPGKPCPEPDQRARMVSGMLTSERALSIFRTWTSGTIRYRLEWAGAGHRRSDTWRCAGEIGNLHPELINDSRESLWEAIVSERKGRLQVEIWPRGLTDPRFFYRRRDVPASSHPTLAAALARVAQVEPDDVVWDPFVGSATELIERGLAGPYTRLLGCDIDPGALDAARENLEASGLANWDLVKADARQYSPSPRPSLVITNPPMGRRVFGRVDLESLYQVCMSRIAGLLVPGGRFVWISPLFEKTCAMAHRSGLRQTYRQKLDMGGFAAELQAFVKPV